MENWLIVSGIGMVSGVYLCGASSDKYLRSKINKGGMNPEHRFPPMAVGAVVIPVGLFLYGWAAEYHVQWIAPIVGTALVGFGLICTALPVTSYLVDAFTVHAASAIAAVLVLRCCAGAILPLAGPPLYGKLGLGWGNTVLGLIALAFVPVPLLFMKYGKRIRTSARFRVNF